MPRQFPRDAARPRQTGGICMMELGADFVRVLSDFTAMKIFYRLLELRAQSCEHVFGVAHRLGSAPAFRGSAVTIVHGVQTNPGCGPGEHVEGIFHETIHVAAFRRTCEGEHEIQSGLAAYR